MMEQTAGMKEYFRAQFPKTHLALYDIYHEFRQLLGQSMDENKIDLRIYIGSLI